MLSVLTAAAATQNVVKGSLLLLVFGLGRVVPLFFVGLSTTLAARLEPVARRMALFERAFGVVFVALGGYYLYQAWLFFRALAELSLSATH